jgi:hypothetical protein
MVIILMLKNIKLQSMSVFFALTVLGLSFTTSAQEMSALSPSVVNTGYISGYRAPSHKLSKPHFQVQILLWKSQPQWDHSNWFVADEALPVVVADIEVNCGNGTVTVSTRMSIWRMDWDTGISSTNSTLTCWITRGSITNPSINEYNGYYVGFVIGVDGNYEAGGAGPINIPARKECSAGINDLPLGTLLSGDSKSIQWPYTTKNGSIELSGSHIRSEGTLELGGKSSVLVRPTSNKNIKEGNHWVTPEISQGGEIPLSVNVSPGATGGVYQSVLTARLSCQ